MSWISMAATQWGQRVYRKGALKRERVWEQSLPLYTLSSTETTVITSMSSKFGDIQSKYSKNDNSWPLWPGQFSPIPVWPTLSLLYPFCSNVPLLKRPPLVLLTKRAHHCVSLTVFFPALSPLPVLYVLGYCLSPSQECQLHKDRDWTVWFNSMYPVSGKAITQ